MNTHLLLASALRTLIMGVTLFAALHLSGIRQVRAQRTAWLLALLAALAMPVFVGAGIGLRILPSLAHQQAPAAGVFAAPAVPYRLQQMEPVRARALRAQAPVVATLAEPATRHRRWPISYAATLYCAVAAFLMMRLAVGLALALRLRSGAERSDLAEDAVDIRISHRIATPLTIASSVLLPASSAQWSEAKRRIVLSHETAHIRQRDFYIQLLAGVNCAIFWFNPFSWWLQRHLSALGEAMSDLAALDEAESRVSYAEVLLEFATSAQWPLTGVAMARRSSLRVRIERLLSERLFEQSYTGRRRLTLLAAAIGVVAVCGSTSLVRVHAAQRSPWTMPASAPAVHTDVTAPVRVTIAPKVTADVTAGVVAPVVISDAVSAPNVTAAPATVSVSVKPSAAVDVADNVSVNLQEAVQTPPAPSSEGDHNNSSYNSDDNDNGDSYAVVSAGGSYSFNGNWNQMGPFDAIRKGTHGDFIYYRHDGKSYVIDDPALVAQAKALYAPMEALGKQQEALGRQQEALGRQQEALGKRQEGVKVPNPDLSKETAEMELLLRQMQKIEAEKEVDREGLAKLQEHLGEVQGKLGELQGRAGEMQGKLGEEQGALGEQQGKLGEEQGRLGEQQGKLGEEAHRQMVPLMQQAIRDGKARPVE